VKRQRAVQIGVTLWLAMAGAFAQALERPFSRKECESELCSLLSQGRLDDLRWPDFTQHREEITRFYEANSYRLAWVEDGKPASRTRVLALALRRAADHGLDPDQYDARRWATRLLELDQHTLPEEALARFDLAFTVALTRYVSDLRDGRANPGIYGGVRGQDPERLPLADTVARLAAAGDVAAALETLQPPFPGYRSAVAALRQYRALAAADSGEKLPAVIKAVDPGQPYSGLARLAELLRRLGDLPGDASVDTSDYTEPLVSAVKRFQERHGLEPDGRIGKGTLAALNTPLTERVKQLEIALERWRWLPRGFARSILINIPEFRLRALDASHRTELEMKIVVGEARRTPTPLLNKDMKYVIWRPYWNVPYNIQRKELVPSIEKDPGYLARNGYEVVTPAGEVVSSGEVTPEILAQLKAYSLRLRQKPGPKNSLGLVKFLFPNEDNVYLHDTPAKSLFDRARRDFSHGCMRVANPAGLAEWVLRPEGDWPPERIAAAMQGPDNTYVTLKQPIPVRVVYHTAAALETGEVRFFEDIYGMDPGVWRKLGRQD
jgi:murein L,D-transpeptidase YcbB/YkuD